LTRIKVKGDVEKRGKGGLETWRLGEKGKRRKGEKETRGLRSLSKEMLLDALDLFYDFGCISSTKTTQANSNK
jgi:hypothetical protein